MIPNVLFTNSSTVGPEAETASSSHRAEGDPRAGGADGLVDPSTNGLGVRRRRSRGLPTSICAGRLQAGGAGGASPTSRPGPSGEPREAQAAALPAAEDRTQAPSAGGQARAAAIGQQRAPRTGGTVVSGDGVKFKRATCPAAPAFLFCRSAVTSLSPAHTHF